MLSRFLLSTRSASGSVSSVRPRLSLSRARIAENRFESVDRVDDVVDLPVEPRRQLREPGNQVDELALPTGDGLIGLVGDLFQRTDIALVDHHTERREHLLGGREAARVGLRDPRPVAQPALSGLVRRAEPVRCAANPAATSGRPSRSRWPAAPRSCPAPVSLRRRRIRRTAARPICRTTLPTVTSSTMTGEFCGSVATSGSSTVIE